MTQDPAVRHRRLMVLAALGLSSVVVGLLLLLDQRGAPLFVVGAVVFSAGCGWLVSAAIRAIGARRQAR